MGKSSAPTPPPAPSASEIAAANTESARAMMELQRAMQFGDEVMKKGYMREKLGVPKGATPVYSEPLVSSSAPKYFALGDQPPSRNRPSVFEVQSDGTLALVDGYRSHPDYERFIGMQWAEAMAEGGVTGHQTQFVQIKQPIKSLTGYKNADGTITEAHQYFKISEDGEREAVKREEAIQADFTGMGDTDLARQQWEFEKETSPERTQFLLDQAKQFGPEFMEQARDLVERSDPTGFAARELLGKLAQEYQPADVPEAEAMEQFGEVAAAERLSAPPSLGEVAYTPEYERAGEQEALRRVGEAPQFAELDTYGPNLERAAAMNQLERSQAAPSLERLEDVPEITADPDSIAGRRYIEQQLLGRAESGRTADLMSEEARRIARNRAAATGNIFGGGAVIEESRAVRQAEDAGQRQAISELLGFLSSGQTASDYESRIAQQNLANRLMGIQQRTGAEQAEFGMGQTVLGQRNTSALQERADELASMSQRNEAQQQEYQNLQASLAQINQVRQQQLAADVQAAGFDNTAVMQERADELAAMGQRNQAEESEYQNLLQGLQQQQNARTAGFGMQAQAVGQRNQAQEADFAREQAAIAQRNQARQQSFANAMQRTATQQQMQQQQMANLQSFSGLAPVSSQFGGLSGAQQQAAANFNPIQYQPTSAAALLQGQQNLQGNIFGTQANIWGQQAQAAAQPSGFGQVLGTVGGAWAGTTSGGQAITAGLKKLFT